MLSHVFLLDLDGVLIRPGGYTAALEATLAHFARLLGLPDTRLVRSVVAWFHAEGVVNEWDIIPVALAVLLDALLAQSPNTSLPDDLTEACRVLAGRRSDLQGVEAREFVHRICAVANDGARLALALQLCSLPQGTQALPHLARHPALLQALFGAPDEPAGSPAMAVFETYALGSAAFGEAYRLPPPVETPSLLAQHDRSLLPPAVRDRLLALWEAGDLALAAYTARPSLPPRGIPAPRPNYAPEAEIALDLAGLSLIPLIGYGRLAYLAEQGGLRGNDLLKPAPFHALAAVLAAITRDEQAGLQWAEAISQDAGLLAGGRPDGVGAAWPAAIQAALPPRSGPLRVHIFEDSAHGLLGARSAVALLERAGVPVELHLWGIATSPARFPALKHAGARVYTRVDHAMAAALATHRVAGFLPWPKAC